MVSSYTLMFGEVLSAFERTVHDYTATWRMTVKQETSSTSTRLLPNRLHALSDYLLLCVTLCNVMVGDAYWLP